MQLLLTKCLRDYVHSLNTTFAFRKKDKRTFQGRREVRIDTQFRSRSVDEIISIKTHIKGYMYIVCAITSSEFCYAASGYRIARCSEWKRTPQESAIKIGDFF